MDVKALSGGQQLFKILARESLQPRHHRAARDAVLQNLAVRENLPTDRGADEFGAVGIDPLLNQQIDVPEIDEAEIEVIFSDSDSLRRASSH